MKIDIVNILILAILFVLYFTNIPFLLVEHFIFYK